MRRKAAAALARTVDLAERTCDESLYLLLNVVQHDVIPNREDNLHLIDVPDVVLHIGLDTERMPRKGDRG